jgi:hypothetical protein
MRFALGLVVLAACGGGGWNDIALDQLPACPSCGPGHVRGGVVAHAAPGKFGADMGRDGDLLFVAEGDEIEWLTPDLEVARRATVPFDGAANGGPWIERVVSAPDGTAFVTIAGYPDDTGAEQVDLVALDGGGGVRWRGTILTHGRSGTVSLAIAGDGGVIVTATSLVEAPNLGHQPAGVQAVIAELAAATGSLVWSRPLSGDQGVVDGALPIYANGDRFAIGGIQEALDLGGAAGTVAGPGLLVARVDGAGTGAWARVLRSPDFVGSDGGGGGVAVGAGDRVYVATAFGTSLDLGDGTVLSPPPEDVDARDIVIALDASGAVAWTALSSFRLIDGVAATARGAIFGQSYDAAGEIGGAPLATPEQTDGACAELIDGAPAWTLTITGPGYQSCAPIGAIDGRSFALIGSSGGASYAQASLDGQQIDGDAGMLVEVGTE